MKSELDIAVDQIKRDEGLRLHPYHCSEGVLTIGYGRSLEKGITEDEAELLLRNDLETATTDALQFSTPEVWTDLNADRKAVLINMAFNLGITRLLKFKKFRSALHRHDYHEAANQMLDSRWARQVGQRALRLADSMRGS